MVVPYTLMATTPSSKTQQDAEFTWRNWMFGDSHSHHFKEALARRVPKEVGCALTASLLVSPLVSIIDKCMVREISGAESFLRAIKNASKEMIFQPRKFYGGLSFRLTVAVYFGTYAVANLSELYTDIQQIEDDAERRKYKVGAASAANIGLLAWRDSVFARVYSNAAQSAANQTLRTPLRTIGLFAGRDAATMYATFSLSPAAAVMCQNEYGIDRNVAELGCALGIPMLTQFATAPLHIHAMDVYNRRAATLPERLATIRHEFSTIAFARGLRILPAFGIGSFSNNKLRERFIQHEYEAENFHLPYRYLGETAMATSTSASE